MSLVKTPSVPVVKTLEDVARLADQLRVFFADIQKNGGVITVQDLTATGLVDNNLNISKRMVTK